MPAVPNSLTPMRRKAPEITPLSAKPNVMTAVVMSWMSARSSAAMPPTSRSHGPIHSVMQPMKASCWRKAAAGCASRSRRSGRCR